ncbi:MAG: acyl-CoA thioesterase [Chloroflexi bacterium]|nr:acyl-CoA thioesterase [Chloroflexota bacterium]
MNKLLAKYPVVIEIPVAWGDMDALGHVNNTIYLRYFESARIAYFQKLGFFGVNAQSNVGPILGSVQCKFKMPLTYPDIVSVGTRITHIEEDRFVMEHCIVSHQAHRIAAEGEGVIVAYNYREKKKTRLPDDLKQRIHDLEATVSGSA